jgi:NAD(P)-dependent dehydrogenase (short-subunit alcohol dehydrogenase family)
MNNSVDNRAHRVDYDAVRTEAGLSRVLVTGSSDGLGRDAARLLVETGHEVVLHARNAGRARDALDANPGARGVLVGDLSSIEQTRDVAEQANRHEPFDAIIHNAAAGPREPRRVETADGLAHVFAINALAPYLLTALITRPGRLVYLSSDRHLHGDPGRTDPRWVDRPWDGGQAYDDAKLGNVLLAFAVARYWPDVRSNAVNPGWVATKMGGTAATGDLNKAPLTQVWLATSNDREAMVSGRYFFHQRPARTHPAAGDPAAQDHFLALCRELTGVALS